MQTLSCLEEFGCPRVGEFEVSIGAMAKPAMDEPRLEDRSMNGPLLPLGNLARRRLAAIDQLLRAACSLRQTQALSASTAAFDALVIV